jgi:hypothetical protein
MKVNELHDALEALAGPAPAADADALHSVHQRVRRTRTRWFGAAAVVAIVVVAGAVAFTRSGDDGPSVATAPERADACARLPKAVPPDRVPAAVAAWAGSPVPTSQGVLPGATQRAVLGEGGIWTVREALTVRGQREGDGWLVKFPWFTIPSGTPTITGRRLDGPGRFRADANVAFDASGAFVASGLEFSEAGCWKVTARYRGSTLTFPMRVG